MNYIKTTIFMAIILVLVYLITNKVYIITCKKHNKTPNKKIIYIITILTSLWILAIYLFINRNSK